VLGALGLLDAYNERTRRFLRLFFPFILTGVVFDGMRYFYWQGIEGRVHVAEPYLFELRWFGVGGRTPNEWFLDHHWKVADLLAGFAYLTYVGEYLAIAFVLFARERDRVVSILARSFLLVNVLGYVTYFVYAAAPPWYVTQYGLGPARTDVQPDAAAAQRFDQLLGTRFFDEMYGRGVDVYGAYPSLHVAYPLIAAVVVWRLRELRWLRAPTALFSLLMCFSAVYLQHHYVTDVVLGAAYAVVALAIVTRLSGRAEGLGVEARRSA
jgi:membrane-associated phospholipid phosphatase